MSGPAASGAGTATGRMLRFFFMVALVGVLLAVGYWILRDRGPGAEQIAPGDKTGDKAGGKPAVQGSQLVREARLSATSKRDEASPNPLRFRSGDEIYAHFVLEKPATLFVALLNSGLGLSALSPVPIDGTVGANSVGPQEVEDGAGREAVIVIASETARTKDDFLRLLGRATDAVRGVESQFDAKLQVILATLRAHEGMHAEAIEYEHVR